MPNTRLQFTFPLPRPLTGICLGNGAQGLLIWGSDTLNITIARNGFWDHRGARKHREVVPALKPTESIREEAAQKAAGPPRPYQLGGARLVVRFPDGLEPQEAVWNLESGGIDVLLSNRSGRTTQVRICQAPDHEIAFVKRPEEIASQVKIELIPAWNWIREKLQSWGIDPPSVEYPEDADGLYSIVQRLPDDPALAIAARRVSSDVVFATALGRSPDDNPLPIAEQAIAQFHPATCASAAADFWSRIMKKVPRLNLPDATLSRQYLYGIARLVGCTSAESPDAPACSLQGPFMEDNALPPWSNDYHMNINVQMVYWPLLQTNLHENFAPLWKMLKSWVPLMQERGAAYFGTPGAFLMPTAADDRGDCVGAWQKTFGDGRPVNDHNCLPWMARLAWLHYEYSRDERLLSNLIWPLLNGAFEAYWTMCEATVDGDGNEQFSMPYTMSPEYHCAGRNWGRDSSFQLAACHSVLQTLPKVAQLLGKPADDRWAELENKLPRYNEIVTVPDLSRSGPGMVNLTAQKSNRRIAVWEDEDYSESHRHPSHLAAFYPLEIIDPLDPGPNLAEVVENTYNTWTLRGTGFWTGWSFPLASILSSRYLRPTAAVSFLHQLATGFTNEGGNTGNDGASGLSILKWRSAELAERNSSPEIIQMDAALGAVSAILEILVQVRPNGMVHVLPALPPGWRDLRFENIGCPGGFRISATLERGQRREIRIHSSIGGTLRIAHYMGNSVLVDDFQQHGVILECSLQSGQEMTIRPN